MRKITFLSLLILAFWSCQHEEYLPSETDSAGIASKDYVLLSDGNSEVAGTLKIDADLSDVEITWITRPACNLNTEQASVALENGKGELPIRWSEKQTDGNYAPKGTAFRAWVKLTGEHYSKIVPLVWSEKTDDVALQKLVQTRASVTPKTAVITFNPPTVVMDNTGGSVNVILENANSVSFTYNGLEETNIDISTLPTSITENTTLNFRWKNNTPATKAFTVAVVGMSDSGLWNSFTLVYTPGGGDNDPNSLVFDSSTLPDSKIPQAGGSYTFNFTGNYKGQLRVRSVDATSGETVLFNGAIVTTHAPKVTVPANAGTATRNIKFQYRLIDVANSPWVDLPASTNRVQEGEVASNVLDVTAPQTQIGYQGGVSSLTITSNTSWTVTSNVTWANVFGNAGTGNGKSDIVVQENTNTTDRTAIITVKTTSGLPEIVRTITLVQQSRTASVNPGGNGTGATIGDFQDQNLNVSGGGIY